MEVLTVLAVVLYFPLFALSQLTKRHLESGNDDAQRTVLATDHQTGAEDGEF